MRIALVYRSFSLFGSAPRATVELARHLSPRHEVHVFAIDARTDTSLAPTCTFHDVPVGSLREGVPLSARQSLTFGLRAARLLRREQFDVVHVCNPSTWVGEVLHLPGVARGEAERRGFSYPRYIASNVRHPRHAARSLLERRAIANHALRRIHVDAPSVLVDLERYHGISPDRVLVVTPAVSLEEFHPAEDVQFARASISVQEQGRTVLLFCGTNFDRKGLDRAIEAVAASNIDAELLVVGSCPDEERFRALARARGVSDRVRFLGRRSDTARYFQAADILLLPTRADVWGVTPIEAMACGIPSIVSDAAGSASVVRQAGSGIVLSEPFDQRDLLEAVEHLAHDPALRREMGRKGLAAVHAHTWTNRGRIVEDDILGMVEERRRERSSSRS